jgi:exopolysaccharide biosynthesis predicted pyruvyltransferase EpsI
MDRFTQIINIKKALKEAQFKAEAKKKTFQSKEVNLADYPWEECIADQVERYGDEETAAKVCGAIKAMNAAEQQMEIEPNPCWENYQPIGIKEDGSPNCVPIKE